MKSLFVIVHEGTASYKNPKVHREIKRIKRCEEFRVIDGDPQKIPEDLPSANEYEILVCGARTDVCIPAQIEALEKAGYRVRIYMPASFP